MKSSESERCRQALQRTLDDPVVLLDKHRVAYGAPVREIAGRVAADREGLSTEDRHRLLGGMGNLTDVWTGKRNGHDVDDQRSANAELDRLRVSVTRVFVADVVARTAPIDDHHIMSACALS